MGRVLIVAAHPDDEVLGCGGTIARHIDEGDDICVIFLADGEASRISIPETLLSPNTLQKRRSAAKSACGVLGVENLQFFDFPDNGMDTVPLLKVTQCVEAVVNEYRPETVYTHHGGDLNIDHRICHQAVITACRPMPGSAVKEILTFEVLSSTEWSSPSIGPAFNPNCYIDINATFEKKLDALRCYDDEMRDFPHSRSYENVKHLAAYRGGSTGINLAEAFYIERALR
ncbi:MAG: PIG-L deacetylase family protein [Pseudomonadales bacterium]